MMLRKGFWRCQVLTLLFASGYCGALPITQGTITFTSSMLTPATLNLTGDGFGLVDLRAFNRLSLQSPVSIGSTFFPGMEIAGSDIYSGSASLDSENYGSLGFGSILAQRGSYFRISASTFSVDVGAGIYRGNFSFQGQFCGINSNGPTIPPGIFPCVVFFPELTGSGLFEIELAHLGPPGPGSLRFARAEYTFVAEPSTIWILGTAFMLLALMRRQTIVAS
jgi:hypothetical protein